MSQGAGKQCPAFTGGHIRIITGYHRQMRRFADYAAPAPHDMKSIAREEYHVLSSGVE